MQDDPLETKNLASLKDHRDVLARHRELLVKFGEQHEDDLVSLLLTNDV